MIAFIVALVFAFKWTYKQEKGRYQIDKLALKLPIFGDLD